MMAQGDLAGTNLLGKAIQGAPAQAGAQATGGFSLGNDRFHHAVGVPFQYIKGNPKVFQVIGQYVLGKIGLLLIQVDGNQFKIHRGTGLEVQQDVQHGVGILASRQAHHDPVPLFDHGEIRDRVTHVTPQALTQFVEGVVTLAGVGSLARAPCPGFARAGRAVPNGL